MKRFYFLLLFSLFLFCSCRVSDPKIGQARAVVIFDYKSVSSLPSVRMCAFINFASEYNRFAELKIVNKKEKLVWKITKPVFITDSRNIWAGSTSLYGGSGPGIPIGDYEVTYTDLAERSVKYYCKVDYPKELASTSYSGIFFSESVKQLEEYVVLFSEKNDILYMGKSTEDLFESDKKILERYPSAKTKRTLFAKSNLSYGVLLPVEAVKN